MLFEPGDDVLLTGAEAVGSVERGALGVVGFPVEIGAGSEEALGGAALPARAGVPEALRHRLRGGAGGEQFFEADEQAERTGVPQLVDPGASGNEEAGDVPAGIADGVVER